MRNGAVADALVAASAPGARVELHTMAMDGGVMKMRALERLPMAAGETVALKPGGAHLMFYGLERPGRTIPVTLQFASGATVVVEAEVRQAGAEPNPHAGH
jgi:copper(I)-binding protein